MKIGKKIMSINNDIGEIIDKKKGKYLIEWYSFLYGTKLSEGTEWLDKETTKEYRKRYKGLIK